MSINSFPGRRVTEQQVREMSNDARDVFTADERVRAHRRLEAMYAESSESFE